MQVLPPDYDDAKHKSLNAYRGKHALGDRARKIDQGILITRFELPFNIWCGTCNAHIGMGVRYNAEKKKIGMYYSTPIFSFRCKCHLCSGWFEIQTDPQNTRYVVVSGARKKEEDWDPAENGGFAVIDTDSKIEPVDPLAALEKTTDAQAHATKVQAPRLEQLEDLSAHYNEDPYTHSRRVRKRFRAEKKVEQARVEADKSLKEKYGLPTELALERADDPGTTAEARDEWARGLAARAEESASRKRKLALEAPVLAPSRRKASTSTGSAASSLRARILSNSARRTTAASAGTIGALIPPTSRKGTSSGLAAGIALRKS
ncbi:CWC16 protein [Russula aff. rugulosa BPL654]|nr:CWC16 protein [Russula aff. rugulosa BPL654]